MMTIVGISANNSQREFTLEKKIERTTEVKNVDSRFERRVKVIKDAWAEIN